MNICIKLCILFDLLKLIVCQELKIEEREKRCWRDNPTNDTSIRPFRIKFTKEVIYDLKYRLKNHRKFTPPLKGVAFNYGFNTDCLDGWLDYWANKYDFAAQEAYLNKYSQYKTYIQGLDMHFIWVKPQVHHGMEALPLLILHGFPGSVREFYETIPLLTAVNSSRPYAVEVIAPSLPGFGFSDGASYPGLGAAEIATVCKLLMERLGYKKFYVQGGDWGSHTGGMMATLYPEAILGFHTNYAVSYSPISLGIWFAGSLSPSLVVDPAVEDRMYPLSTILKGMLGESGYLHLQATKPDTLGVAMSDSPAGLLAWNLHLVSTASRRDNVDKECGGLDLYTRNEMLDILMMYWVSNSFTTAARIYAESYNMRNVREGLFAKPTPVPVWSTHTKHEIQYQSPIMLKVKYPNLLKSVIYDDFGHFFALEQPEIFARSVLSALDAFRKWHANNYCEDEL